jgi:Sigma-70, region 4
MADEQPDEENQPRWIDAFPWLEAAAASSGHTATDASAWWLEPVDASGAQRRERLADLSDLALECLTRWTIGQIFPALPTRTGLTLLPMTNRAKNALFRFGYRTTGDLQALELSDLLDLPNVGIGTVDSILQALGDASTLDAATSLPPPPAEQHALVENPCDHNGELAGRARSVVEDLRTLASWYATLGLPDRALLGDVVPPFSPPEVVKARQKLELIAACDVLTPEQTELDAAVILQRRVSALGERIRRVLANRLFADRPVTLDELGQDLGLTRERVRQIEGKARAEMVAELEPGKPLGAVSAAIRELVGVVLPLDDLLSLVPALARLVEGAEQPAWRVLDRLDDSFEIKDGWCAVPTVLSAQTETMTRVQEVTNRHGVTRLSDLVLRSPNQPSELTPASLAEWLRYCGCTVDGDHVFTRLQSVGDRAAAILSIAAEPMSAQDILSRFDVERSLPSLRNAMGSDDRFARVDRDKWALAEWGLASYSGIRAVVRDEVSGEGGRIPLETLIERITGKYSVTASSVIAYASAPPFEARDGVVRFAAGDRDVHKGPERTRRLYRGSDGWLYRVAVTKDHLRGSGSPAPVAVAATLGLQPGQTCELASALGPQTVNWTGNQPAFGTIRRFLIDSDIEIGSEIFLVIGDNGTFRIEPVGAGDTSALDQALRLTGATSAVARQQPRAALAAAIGLPEESPAASVIGGYRERGDGDIADLLLSARDQLDGAPVTSGPEQSPDIDDILELL